MYPKKRWVYGAVAILACSAVCTTSRAQDLVWARNVGGSSPDGAFDIEATSDGGFVAVGFTGSFATSGVNDVYVVKADAMGQVQWTQVVGGLPQLSEFGRQIRQLPDSGYVIAGYLEVNSQTFDALVIRMNAAGDVLWKRTYDAGFGDDDRAHCITPTDDGGFLVGGQAMLPETEFWNYDMYVFKIDADGVLQWRRFFDYAQGYYDNADIVFSVVDISTGGYLVSGWTHSEGWDGWVLRLDDQGNRLWDRAYGEAYSDEILSAREVSTGGFIFSGVNASNNGDTDFWLFRTDESGEVLWDRKWGKNTGDQCEDEANRVYEMPDGGFIAAGQTSSYGAGGWDQYFVRTDAAGNPLWTRVYGGSSDDRAFAVVPAPGGVVAAGWAYSFGNGYGDVHLVKLEDPLSQSGCAAIRKLTANCREGRLTAKVSSSLPEGTELTICLSGGDVRTLSINARGKGKVKWTGLAGPQEVCMLDCPDVPCASADCG
ncbi:MAG: hypothetical protein IT449_09605 [Phycisphaerales bacterium]|nr:hypothetical protein [Phycisphaerales bacterium]